MAFPYTVLDQRIEAFINGAWVDITSYVQRRDRLVSITRGRSDEAGTTERSTARLAVNNRDGRFSPMNPLGPYYGYLNRNTPLRISRPDAVGSYLSLNGARVDEATCPDAAALGITGDIDIRIDLGADSWRGVQNLAAKLETTGNQRSWVWQTNPNGTLTLAWSTAGTAVTMLGVTSTLPVPVPANGRRAVRVTLDVNNGASGHTAVFYYADTIAGPWTQLGDTVITAGTTSIFDSTAGLEVGSATDVTIEAIDSRERAVVPLTGRVYAFELRSGIAGTVVANPTFTGRAAGTTSFADTASSPNTWTVAGGAAIDDRDYRFHGEVPGWPSRWDNTGNDVWVDIEASGILRRLGQGKALYSTLRRALTSESASPPVAYWPCEDSTGSTVLASGLTGGVPMAIAGSPNLASSSAFDCSAPLPVINNSVWTAFLPTYPATGINEVRILLGIPNAGLADGAVLLRVYTSGSAAIWDLVYSTGFGGGVEVNAYDSRGTLLGTSPGDFGHNGHAIRVALTLEQSGSDIDYGVSVDCLNENVVGSVTTTLSSRTAGQVTAILVGGAGNAAEAVIGHLSVHNSLTDFLDIYDELRAYAGETAAARIERLCAEEGVEYRRVGAPDDAIEMGPQKIATLVTLITEAATTDGGILFEPRTVLGLGYRTRAALYNQPVVATLDYAGGELFGDMLPVGDDKYLKNDVTATRTGGSSARFVLEEGALTPDRVGTYPDQVSVNTWTDSPLRDIAAWRVHLGTVEEDRYPTAQVNLANQRIAADTDLVAAVERLDIGQRVQITNVPVRVSPDTVDQLMQGTTETLGNFEHTVKMNTSPASPYNVGVMDDDSTGRIDTSGSELASSVTDAATTLSVTVTGERLWTSDPAMFPFDVKVGGEVMTVLSVGTTLNSNPTFEAGISGYFAAGGGAISHSTAQAHTSTGSCLITTNGGADPRFESSMVAVTAGLTYRASGWVMPMSALPSTANVGVNWYTSGGAYISTSSNTKTPTTGSWIGWDATFTAPPTAAKAGIFAACTGTPGAGILVYVDDVRLRPTASYATSPQPMDVTRSVNGIVKAHSAGADLRLATPAIVAL